MVFDRVVSDWDVVGVGVRSLEGPLRGGGGGVDGLDSGGRTGGLMGLLLYLGAGSGVGVGGCDGGSGSSCVQLCRGLGGGANPFRGWLETEVGDVGVTC